MLIVQGRSNSSLSVEESINNLHFLYIGLHLYRSKPHNIHMKRDHLYCIVHVQVQRIQVQVAS